MKNFTRKPLFITWFSFLLFSFSIPAISQNRLDNPGFETWTAGKPDAWSGSKTNLDAGSVLQYTTNVHGGTSACQLINATTNHKRFTSASLSVQGGQTYRVKFWLRGSGEVRTGLWDGLGTDANNYIYNTYVQATSTWMQHQQTVVAPQTVNNAELIFSIKATSGENVVIDDVEMVAAGEPALTADFVADKTFGTSGMEIHFTDVSSGHPVSWEWTVTGPETFHSAAQNPSFTFTMQGAYDVTLAVSNGTATDDMTKTTYITIGDFILFQDWSTSDWRGWFAVSLLGDQKWMVNSAGGPDGSPCVQMNGFQGVNNANEDWLISPDFIPESTHDLTLRFDNAYNYSGDMLKLFITDNYTGNPATTTWYPLSFTASPGNLIWTNSGDVKFTGEAGKVYRLAFQYTSTNLNGSLWRLDNITLMGFGILDAPKQLEANCSVYPNPCVDRFSIEKDDFLPCKLTVYNLQGLVMLRTDMAERVKQVEVTDFKPGIYMVELQNQVTGSRSTSRIVIK